MSRIHKLYDHMIPTTEHYGKFVNLAKLRKIMYVYTTTPLRKKPFKWELEHRYEKELPLRFLLHKDYLKMFTNMPNETKNDKGILVHAFLLHILDILAPEVSNPTIYRPKTKSLYNKVIGNVTNNAIKAGGIYTFRFGYAGNKKDLVLKIKLISKDNAIFL